MSRKKKRSTCLSDIVTVEPNLQLDHSAQAGYTILGRRSIHISQLCQTIPSVSEHWGYAQPPDKWCSGRDIPENGFVLQIFSSATLSELFNKTRVDLSRSMVGIAEKIFLVRSVLGRRSITRRDVITVAATGSSRERMWRFRPG